jgi:1,4-dihydroxy-2-naphthoyl-CoA synthase
MNDLDFPYKQELPMDFRSSKDPSLFTQIEYKIEGPLAIISLNRPEVRNCVSLTMTMELDDAFAMARLGGKGCCPAHTY